MAVRSALIRSASVKHGLGYHGMGFNGDLANPAIFQSCTPNCGRKIYIKSFNNKFNERLFTLRNAPHVKFKVCAWELR